MSQSSSLSESWLAGSIEPVGYGLISRARRPANEFVFYAVAEARRAVEGQTEEYVRKVWDILATVFRLWCSENGVPESREQRDKQIFKLFKENLALGREKVEGVWWWKIDTHYDLYCHLRVEQYKPLVDIFAAVSEEHALSALVLHDCANNQKSDADIAGAVHELTFRNGYKAAFDAVKKSSERGLPRVISLLQPMLEKMKQQKEILKSGRRKGQKTNKRRAESIRKLFRVIYTDMLRNQPAWTLDEHAEYIAKWGKGQGVTIDGIRNPVPYLGTTFEVRTGGKRHYKARYIKDVIKGQRRKRKSRSNSKDKSRSS